jgi:hypothetical protein
LTFPGDVHLTPLAVSTLFDHPGVALFQIEQTTPSTLRVRIPTVRGARSTVN